MNRREVLGTIVATSVVGVAGCASSEEDPEDSDADNPDNDNNGDQDSQDEIDYDSGVVYDDYVRNLRDKQVDLVTGQVVTVEASEIKEGERLRFQVGDGTGFVHSYNFYEEDDGTTNEYEIDSDGQHQLQLNPDRHEAPVNEDVEIYVRMEISDP